ncbi:hypothetical protein ETD86_37265 [Nonomuraea turkmeniaca]|uniref:Uncharacterized protein n=1 Tax=Nonomuraea turkmeniaca TaxID=103838 RepID=A0A5S4F4I2_9ACTN|nr:hypothetical protein [Nonomuraea turkmeniaca]TMR10969.1 hypothetical protein ETD86_37265 [Nonomuraea turkmeniaca]
MDADDVLLPASPSVAARAEAGGMPVYEQRRYIGPGPDREPVNGLVLVNPAHGVWLRAIAALDVEIAWATSWHQTANALLARAYDLPDLPVMNVGPYDSDTRFGCSLKSGAILEHVGDRPLVWVDNVFGGKDSGWGEDRTAAGSPTLLIHVDASVALVKSQMDAVTRWLTDLRETAPW